MDAVSEFVPERASREEWRRYHAFRRLQEHEWRPLKGLLIAPFKKARPSRSVEKAPFYQ